MQGEGSSQTYQFFILLFFILSIEGGSSKVHDAMFTLSAVFLCLPLFSLLFFFESFPKLLDKDCDKE